MKKLKTGVITGGVGLLLFAASCGSNTTKQASTTTMGNKTSSAPSGQAAANQNVALVRFINGIPNETVTLAFNGTAAFSDVKYGAADPYKELPADGKDFGLFKGKPGNNTPPLASSSSGLSSGGHYTVVAALDEGGNRKLDVITDDLAQPSNGKAEVRLINASAQEVQVTAPEQRKSDNQGEKGNGHANSSLNNKADKWFSSVSPAGSKGYKEIDPINGTLDIEKAAGGSSSSGGSEGGGSSTPKKVSPVLQLPVDFMAGKLYTIVVTGGTEKHPLKAMTIEDQLTGSTSNNQNQ